MAIKFVSYLRKSSDMLYIKELTGEFVESVKTLANYRFIKVGQTKSYLSNQRHLHLNATNKCNLEDLTDMVSLAHPFDIRYKLTDHTVRKQIVEDNKFVKPIDKLFAKNAFGMTDGFSEILMFPAEWSDDKICKTITSSYNKLMNSDVSNFTKNTEREDEYNKNKNEYIVPTSIAQLMYKEIVKTAKRVLIIRQFPDWFVDRVCQTAEHVTYIIDNDNASIELPEHKNLELIKCDSFDGSYKNDLEEYFENMSEKFDLVIANPPYSIGNKVITEVMKHCNEAVVLMPGSKYADRSLYKHVKNIDVVSSQSFDATIADLTIATLDKDKHCSDYNNEFIYYRYDEEIIPFVTVNSKIKHPYLFKSDGGDKVYLAHLDINIDFLLSGRVLDDGVHNDERAVDFQFNMNNTIIKSTYQCVVVRFPDAAYKRNFANFWYNNPLMHNILKGAHSSGFRTEVWNLIPKLDYSKDRDYANLTLDDIVKILEEENR